MNRKIAALALGVLVVTAGACSKDAPVTTTGAPATGSPTTLSATQDALTKEMPMSGTVVPVSVTKPASPTSIDPATLPEKARAAGKMVGLTPEDQICVNYAMKQALDKDAALATTDGALAGLGGSAIAACMGDQRAADLVTSRITGLKASLPGGAKATEAEVKCVKDVAASTPSTVAGVLSGVLAGNLGPLAASLKPFETACKVTLMPSL